MVGFTETDILGRRIERLAVLKSFNMTGNRLLFTCGQSPEIASSGKTVVCYVAVTPAANATTALTTLGFGSSSGATDWTNGQYNVDAMPDSPKMFFPSNGVTLRPTSYANGIGFYSTPGTAGAAFTAGATADITLYGFTY